MEAKKKVPVTVFLMGEFGMGVKKYEGWLVETGRRRYAQYEAAPFVRFIPKGKRNPREWQGTYKPYCVVLNGHGHPIDPGSPFVPCESATPGVTVQRSRYTMFDERWESDFDKVLDAYMKPAMVVADYRHVGPK